MAIVMVHDSPGGTREQYEPVAERLTGGRGLRRDDAHVGRGAVWSCDGPGP